MHCTRCHINVPLFWRLILKVFITFVITLFTVIVCAVQCVLFICVPDFVPISSGTIISNLLLECNLAENSHSPNLYRYSTIRSNAKYFPAFWKYCFRIAMLNNWSLWKGLKLIISILRKLLLYYGVFFGFFHY